jgi:tetratricopeptide (TPR) repeat protein
MKKLVPGLFVLVAGLSVPVVAQQHSSPCGGPAPAPPRIADGSTGPSTSLEAWADAMAHWVPCSDREMVPGAVISAHALSFKPLKAARKDFDQGMRAVNKGLNAEALEHFREAVRLDPGYVQPHVQTGMLRAQAGQPMLALESFLRALAIEPDAEFLEFDVAHTLVMLHRPSEAESYARRVTRRSPSFVDGQYVLGLALVMQDKLTPEAVGALRLAAKQNSKARGVLAWVEWKLSAARVSGPSYTRKVNDADQKKLMKLQNAKGDVAE